MDQQEHRFFGMVEKGGLVFFVTSTEPVSHSSEKGAVITNTDLKFWEQVSPYWFYQVVGKNYVHVAKTDDQYSVRIMRAAIDEAAPEYYDSFAEAIVRGQIEVDRLEDEHSPPMRKTVQA
jgi:hypothetical protein